MPNFKFYCLFVPIDFFIIFFFNLIASYAFSTYSTVLGFNDGDVHV